MGTTKAIVKTLLLPLCVLVAGFDLGVAVHTNRWLFPHFCTTQE